jgi:hypothetical protein
MSNLRTRNRLPHNFIDGIAIQGIDVTRLKDISSPTGSTLVGHNASTVKAEIDNLYITAQGLIHSINILSNVYNTLNGEAVKITGNQSIAGTKTFTSTIAGSINGNSATATKLATARTISGVPFDGTVNIDLPDASIITKGILALATTPEAEEGINTIDAMTPANVEAHMVANALGWGQTWQNVTGSRAINVEYQNLTGRPILLVLFARASGARFIEIKGSNPGASYVAVATMNTIGEPYSTVTVVVPSTNYYRLTADDANISSWAELR